MTEEQPMSKLCCNCVYHLREKGGTTSLKEIYLYHFCGHKEAEIIVNDPMPEEQKVNYKHCCDMNLGECPLFQKGEGKLFEWDKGEMKEIGPIPELPIIVEPGTPEDILEKIDTYLRVKGERVVFHSAESY